MMLTPTRRRGRGWDVLLQDIRRRLRCPECGRRAQRLLVGYHQAAVPDG
jgi:transposase